MKMDGQWKRTAGIVASGTARIFKRQRTKGFVIIATLVGFCVLLLNRSDGNEGGILDSDNVPDDMLVNDYGNNNRLLVPKYR